MRSRGQDPFERSARKKMARSSMAQTQQEALGLPAYNCQLFVHHYFIYILFDLAATEQVRPSSLFDQGRDLCEGVCQTLA